MSIAVVDTALTWHPCPDWCVNCKSPDPGVVDHYSRVWEGDDYFDGATWRVQVTQRVTPIEIGVPVVDCQVTGTFGSARAAMRAMSAAENLKDRINADRVEQMRGGAR